MKYTIKTFLITFFLYHFVTSAPYEVFVSPTGNDSDPGTETRPLKTLPRARDLAVANKTIDGMIVTLLSGTFKIDNFALSNKHSGSNAAPFVIRGKDGASAILSGGIELKYENSKLCDASDIAAGIDSAYASNIRKWSFDDLGITDTSCWSIAKVKKDQIPQLFCNDSLMKLAQWPDTGYTKIDSLITTKPSETEYTHITGDSIGKFILKNAPLRKWEKEISHIVLGGYWFVDYLFSFELIEKIDSETGFVQLATPPSSWFGYRQGQRFYAANLLCEIKKEGRWAADPTRRILYFWYPKYINGQTAKVMLNGNSSISLDKANYVTFKNMTIENFINNSMVFSSCTSNVIDGCLIRNVGGSGIMLKNTVKTNIVNCKIFNIGKSPIWIIGGDRTNLTSSDITIENNKIHDFGTVKKTYKPAVNLDSGAVGCRVAYNTIYNAPHSAIIFMMGNNHVIEYNHIYNVCSETQDAGAIYNGKDWTSRGTIIRNNLIENCGHGDVSAIYIDDASSGITVNANVINNVPRGIKIGGGRDNVVESNTIIKANQWITADNRGLNWLIPAFSEGKTLNVHLTTIPYINPSWSNTYPALLTLLDDNPGCPKGNVIHGNMIYNSGASVIAKEIIQYGLVDSNSIFPSNPHDPIVTKNYGVQKNLNVDTISPVPLLRMPVVPLVRNAFSNAGVLYVACVPSYHSGHLKAKAVNIRSRVVYNGSGGDTVAFPNLIPGDYVYYVWYTDIPYQDSAFSAHDTIHFTTEGILSPKEIYHQPDNPCTLGGKSVDSATIALFWKVNTIKDVVFDSIGVWYNESGYPGRAYDSGSVKAGIWNLKTKVDTITKLKADKLYYFSIFGRDTAGNWSKASDSAKVQVRTGKLSGKANVNSFILQGSDSKLLFSDSLKIWGDELAVSYIDTIDRYNVAASNGFIISGPPFSFRNGNSQENVNINFDIRTQIPAVPYTEKDIRVYRFNINTMAWRLDTAKLTYNTSDHKLLFTTSELGLPFALMIDTMAPHLSAYVTDPAAYNVSDPIYDTFTIHDNIENPKISLFAGPGGKAYSDISYFITPSKKSGSGFYSTIIPAYVADYASGLRAILIVSDGRFGDTINLSRNIVRTDINYDNKKIPAMEWTPLSVTAQPQSSALSEVFSRSLGVDSFNYDKHEQRILQWNATDSKSGLNDKWVEYSRDDSANFKFKLGKTFWVKSKNNLTMSFGAATIPALIDTFEIVLKKGEWSDFSLPYNFDIYTGDIIEATTRNGASTDGIELYEWVKTEKTYTTRAFYLPGIEEVSNPLSIFKAGSVYSAYNNGEGDVVLRIPPVCKSISIIKTKGELAKNGSVSGPWSIKLDFKDDKGIDLSPIYCSALPENKQPRYYQAAPTFSSVCARVANRINGREFGHAASGDLSTGGASFIISCENQSDQTSRVTTTVEKITGLSQETMAVFYYRGEKYDAAQTTLCSMEIPAKQKSTGYLIVGSAIYVSGFIKNLNSVFSFKPFTANRVLRIRYTLPIDVKKMTTLIFDLKGRCLDRIVMTDGLHAGEGILIVNKRFASGYYVLQMKIETIGTTKPAILNRRWMMVR